MKYLLAKSDSYDPITGNSVIRNELITEKEYKKKFWDLKKSAFYSVKVNKNSTYFNFGVRFPKTDTIIHFNSDGKNLIFVGCGHSGKLIETVLF